MIAIAKIGGHQALVTVGEKIEVDKLNIEVGKTVQFEILLIANEDGSVFEMGTPILKNVFVEAKVLEHARGKKVRVFKMRPRKRYRREIGHRQDYTVIEIIRIGDHTEIASKPEKKAEPKKITLKKVSKTTEKADTVVAEKKSPAKKITKK